MRSLKNNKKSLKTVLSQDTMKPRKYLSMITLLAILLLTRYQLFAQFTVDKTSGCAPLIVTVTNTSGIPSVLYDFGQGNGLKPETVSQAYTKAGTYTIQQLVGGFMGMKIQTITVFPNETPQFTVEFCDENQVIVKITSSTMPEYSIDYGDGSQKVIVKGLTSTTYQYASSTPAMKTITVAGFIKGVGTCGSTTYVLTPLPKIPAFFTQVKVVDDNQVELMFKQSAGTSYILEELNENTLAKNNIALSPTATTLTLTNRNLNIDSYIYRINPFNKCKNATTQATTAIGTMTLQVAAKPQQNILGWDIPLYFGFVRYEIYRNNQLIETISSINTRTFIDTKISCNKTYIYRVELVLHEGKSRSISANKSITALATSIPKSVQNFSVSTVSSYSVLKWSYGKGDTATSVIISKKVNGVAENDILVSGNKTEYVDNNVNPTENSYCYTLTYLDVCGNKSPKSLELCTVLLKGTEDEKNVLLTWQGSFPTGATLFLERLTDKDTTRIQVSGGSYTDLKSSFIVPHVRYRLRIVTPQNISYSNVFSVRLQSEFDIPTAFTPNGDGLNEVFRPTSNRFLGNYKMTIFSQWGTVVFESSSPEVGWGGESSTGILAPSGTYAFQINYNDSSGRPTIKQGIVTLIR